MSDSSFSPGDKSDVQYISGEIRSMIVKTFFLV